MTFQVASLTAALLLGNLIWKEVSDKAAPALSGILFTIGIEILGNAIRRSNVIKGIEIDERNTFKLTQHADVTTVFLRDVQSLKKFFNLLAQFENCSGLRINQTRDKSIFFDICHLSLMSRTAITSKFKKQSGFHKKERY